MSRQTHAMGTVFSFPFNYIVWVPKDPGFSRTEAWRPPPPTGPRGVCPKHQPYEPWGKTPRVDRAGKAPTHPCLSAPLERALWNTFPAPPRCRAQPSWRPAGRGFPAAGPRGALRGLCEAFRVVLASPAVRPPPPPINPHARPGPLSAGPSCGPGDVAVPGARARPAPRAACSRPRPQRAAPSRGAARPHPAPGRPHQESLPGAARELSVAASAPGTAPPNPAASGPRPGRPGPGVQT